MTTERIKTPRAGSVAWFAPSAREAATVGKVSSRVTGGDAPVDTAGEIRWL